MKKYSIVKLISVSLVLVVILCGVLCRDKKENTKNSIKNKTEKVNVIVQDNKVTQDTSIITDEKNKSEEEIMTKEKDNAEIQNEVTTEQKYESVMVNKNVKVKSTKKMLFVGDSRTVGLMEYGGIKNADFFAHSGMSVYNIYKKKLSVPKVGKITFKTLLTNKKYDRIYIMMGINEGGYNLDKTIKKYKELVSYIKKQQPKAKIILQANLHVTKKRSLKDKYINNKRINRFNKAISKLADKKRVYYIDANSLFDDSNGNLAANKTADDAHPYAKYYKVWANWIIKKTQAIN